MVVFPPLPEAESIQSGLIWPVLTGREQLRMLSGLEFKPCQELVGQQGLADGSGTSDLILMRAADWCLKTNRRRVYKDLDDARAAIVYLARNKISLGSFLHPQTVIAINQDEEGAYWLWTLTPWLNTLRSTMNRASAARNELVLASALKAFASAAVRAILLASRQNIILDIHPSNFAYSVSEAELVQKQGKVEVFYIDDDITSGNSLPTAGYALLRRIDEYEQFADAIDVYILSLEEAIFNTLDKNDVNILGLQSAFDQIPLKSQLALSLCSHFSTLVSSIK